MLLINSYCFLASMVIIGAMADVYGPVSDHFLHHLNKRPKRNDAIIRQVEALGDTGSFGGKAFSDEKLTNTPIVFIHGNSDSALKYENHPFQTGFNDVIKYFMDKDYTLAELYGITYGNRSMAHSFSNFMQCEYFQLQRRFLEFVLHYTKSAQVNIVAHSMGATIARRIIKGGQYTTSTESCDLGHDLTKRVNTFISIASANYGMCICEHALAFAACGMETGFHPGTCTGTSCDSQDYKSTENCGDVKYSSTLMDLNKDGKKVAGFVASLWSEDDEIIGNLVWGRHTSLVPHSDMRKIYTNLSHMDMKSSTAADQYNIIRMNDQKFTFADSTEY
ncbi:hypothetical protein L5515_018479 [Caenorhabditis briggsae]|uniref:Uncharacterized protein n=2 Tax=Caenorhabditis briggsae TaxID=6238 RepID=A0AAE8ZZ47_CAEBR|nr:hypothetical protein L3Y34_012622 [Caenorhabditis briggsae]UMM42789.1 hypothetical protein L5515_018479 [Caenorhabditis briggsae]